MLNNNRGRGRADLEVCDSVLTLEAERYVMDQNKYVLELPLPPVSARESMSADCFSPFITRCEVSPSLSQSQFA